MVVRETSFLTKDLGDARGESLGVVVGVSVVVGDAPASGEASTFLEAGGECPEGVLRPRGLLESESVGVVCPRGNLPILDGTILFLGRGGGAEGAAASGGVLEMAGDVFLSTGGIFLLPG